MIYTFDDTLLNTRVEGVWPGHAVHQWVYLGLGGPLIYCLYETVAHVSSVAFVSLLIV